MQTIKLLAVTFAVAVLINACSPPEGNFPGSEYMPDMGHSVAVEANTYNYYYFNTWEEASTIPLADLIYPRQTVRNTVPRGYAGIYFASSPEERDTMTELLAGTRTTNAINVPMNGHVPYYYGDTEEERTRATNEIVANPFPITDEGLARGQMLYDIYCGICHGESGNGMGYIYDPDQNPNAKYPLAPANLIKDEFVQASNGRFYHAIMYGKNAMGAYADKMGYEERWQVIHYIRQLQAKETGAEYNQSINTLNPVFGTPAGSDQQLAEGATDTEASMGEAAGQDEE